MFSFLSTKAILTVAKFVLTFLALTVIPLGIIFWRKKKPHASPLIQILDECIRRGPTLSTAECARINKHIHEIKNTLEHFQQDSSTRQNSVSVAQAIEVLPLLYEIAQSGTCCEHFLPDGLNLKEGFDCKSTLRELLHKLQTDPDLPLISEELKKCVQVRQKIQATKPYRILGAVIFILAYSVTAFLLTCTLRLGRPSWKIELGTYLVLLLLFYVNYDYYYSKIFQHYAKKLKKTVKKRTSIVPHLGFFA